jgi:hypothetical protein
VKATLTVMLFVAWALPACAAPILEEGARVRVTVIERKQRPVIGRALDLRPESITIASERDSSRRVLMRSGIRRIEVSTGRKSNAGTGAGIGAITGGMLGLVAGLAISSSLRGLGKGENETAGVIACGGAGAAAGALIGAAIGSGSHHDRWEDVSDTRP